MMAFILATDFDFIAYNNEQNGLFWKLFSRQWRFWNMITLSDESINRGLVCVHMHSIAETLKILTLMC